jgi:hypothetical protein
MVYNRIYANCQAYKVILSTLKNKEKDGLVWFLAIEQA